VVIVIPELDHGPRQIVLITERAQARRVEEKVPSANSRTKTQPARGQDPNKMSAGKEQDISRNLADTLDHTVRPLADLLR
jgi:hypothetical protein